MERLALLRGAVARRGPAKRAGTEAARFRALGRDRRSRDDIVAGDDRRRAELGLPLLLATRLGLHGARVARAWLQARGGRLLLLAAARLAADASRSAGALPVERPGGGGRAVAAAQRLSRIAARPGRERRRRPDPARRLRRNA